MSKRTFGQSMEHGVEAHQAGRYEEALASYRAALDLNPVDAEAISLAGLALLHLERTEQALPLLHQAVELEPNQSGFRLNLAEGLVQANQHDRALHELQVVTAAEPGNARAWTRAGDVSALLGDEAGAIGAWGRAWSLSPTAAPLASKLAQAMIGRRDWSALQRIAAAWTRAHPTSDEAWRVAARAAFEQGRHVAAASAFARVLQVAAPNVADLAAYASLCLHALDIDGATAALDRAEAIDPDYAETLATRALLLMYVGRFAEAEAHCRRCLERDPQNAPAYTTLSRLRRGRLADADLSAVASIARDENAHFDRRIPAAFAVAHAYDARDDIDAAFAAYEQAHALALERDRLENRSYEPARIDERRVRILELSSALTKETVRSEGLPRPIFIVGMPRSGTTLIESVLAAHSRVFACGERLAMRQILQAFLELDASRRTVDARLLRDWSDAYYNDLRTPGEVEHVTDKHPLNFEAAALMARLFPDAAIIHMRRNPIETGLSVYRQEFSKQWTFAHRLEDIGHYYGHYARLVAHWEHTLPGRFTTIQYERFVDNFEHAAPQLVRACGLSWEPQCLDFQRTSRAIATFSTVQARDAVTLGESRAERYEKHLAPLAAALERAGVDPETGALRT